MKAIFHLAVCGALLAGGAIAQHRGGGGGGGGFHGSMGGGISHGGGAVMGGGYRGSMGGFSTGAYRGGYSYGGGYNRGVSYGYRGYGYGYRGYYGGFYGGYYPWYGFGFGIGYSPYYYGGYGYPSSYYYPDTYSYPVSSSYYSTYSPQPTVNVVYPQSQPTTVYVDHSSAGQGAYDQYGQPLMTSTNGNSGSPIYLIATKDHTIQAALSYSVNGSTVEYITTDHQQKRVALDQVDRDLSMRLNRERHVAFQLPGQQ